MNAARHPFPVCHAGVLILSVLVALVPVPAGAGNWAGERITGSGVEKTETRNATGFHGIALGVDAQLELRQGDGEGVSITGDDNIVPLIETAVENGVLKIRWAGKNNHSIHYRKLRIEVSARNIDRLSLAGSGDMHAARLRAGELQATIGGSGNITIDDLDASSLKISLSGSGDFTVAGKVDSLDVALSGSGDVAAGRLEARTARVALQGSGDVALWARESLNAAVSGSGDVTYSGKPMIAGAVAGSGSVRPARSGS